MMKKTKIIKSLIKLLNSEPQFKEKSNAQEIDLKEQDISSNYDQNLEIFKSIFSIPKNMDVKVREFTIRSRNRRAFILFISTMVDIQNIQEGIMEKLIGYEHSLGKIQDIVSYPVEKTSTKIGEIVQYLTSCGMTALFVDGDAQCYLFETTQIRGRSIEKSDNEVIVKGAKEAFNEKVIDNIALVRKKIKNENLIVEFFVLTKRSRNDVFLVYEKDLVNDDLLQAIKDRLKASSEY